MNPARFQIGVRKITEATERGRGNGIPSPLSSICPSGRDHGIRGCFLLIRNRTRPKRAPKAKDMNKIDKLLRVLDGISEWSGKTVSWLALVLTLILGYEIVMRYVFNAPTKWSFDISYMIGGSYFLLGEAYTLLKGKHVRIDIFYSRFSERKKAVVDIVFYLVFFFPLWAGLLCTLVPYVYLSWITDERSMQGYWMPILYPFKTVMPVGILLFLLQGVAEFMRSVLVLRKGGAS